MAIRPRYRNPVPGGTVGRTDQGVDISGPPGTPVYAIADETLTNILPNWYNGQPFYLFKQAGSNIYNYVAEQFASGLRIGQSVRAGQQIGQIAPSGTGLELGFASASGATQAQATGEAGSGYSGYPTAAGASYRRQVLGGGAVPAQRGGASSTLAQLWINNGGSPKLANLMAAIAMAESGGRQNATNKDSNGSVDYGLWQINSVHGFDPNLLLNDPNYNARAAVAVEKSQGLGAWSTYNSGAYKSFLGYTGATPTAGYTRPGGGPSSGDPNAVSAYLNTDDRTMPSGGQFVSVGSVFGGIGNVIIAPLKFALNQEKEGWSQLKSFVFGPADAIYKAGEGVDEAAGEAIKIMGELPWFILRFTEFIVGMVLMGVGMYMALRPSGRSGGLVHSLVEATPLGRVRRIRNARTLGRREGQAEHHRLAARREARATEASKVSRTQAKRLQRTGKAEGDSN